MSPVKNKIVRTILFSIGAVALVLGVIGIFVPLLPTTPFILLAAWCFLKSSSRAYDWIRNQKYLGPILNDWEEHRAISKRTKLIATVLILTSLIMMWIKVRIFALKVAVTILLSIVTTFILTRKSSKDEG